MISTRALSKLLGFSTSAGHRIITKALKKHEAISESNADGWIMIDDDDKHTKYSDKLLNDLEAWMQDNDMIHFNPSKGDTIIKCDRDRRIVRDPITHKAVCVPKLFMTCNPRELHNHMISDFIGATDGDRVLISESKIREILKTSCCHIKMMADRQKMMCRCETCIIFDDIQRCLNLFRKCYISSLKNVIKDITDGPSRVNAKNELQCYIQSVCKDPLGNIPKHASGWEATCKLGCPPVDINGKTYSSMQCAL
jgi:hypothetical protein